MREVGHLGENTFTYWCAQTDLYCNNSKSIDKTSWDFIVELPFATGNSVNELHKSPFECKVQVKASDGKRNSWSLKLSNLKRLCTSALPTFIILIKYEKKDEPAAAFIRHVDKDFITEVLRKIHELEQENEDVNLHKVQYSVKFNNSHRMRELNGHELKRVLIKYVGGDINNYIREKEFHLSKTGFEDGEASIKFSTESKHELANLVNAILGKKVNINVNNVSFGSKRFGVISKETVRNSDQAVISISNVRPVEPVKIKYRHDDFAPAIVVDVNLYGNPLYEVLPADLKKIRIANDFFEIEIYPIKGNFEYTFHFDKFDRLEVKIFLNFLMLYDSLITPNHSPTFEIYRSGCEKVVFRLTPTDQESSFSKIIKTLKLIIKMSGHFGLFENIEVSFKELFHLEARMESFEMLFLGPENFYFEVNNEDGAFQEDRMHIHLFYWAVVVGRFFLAQIVSLKGEGNFEDSLIQVRAREIKLENQIVLEIDECFDLEKAKKSLNQVMEDIAYGYANEYNVSINEAI